MTSELKKHNVTYETEVLAHAKIDISTRVVQAQGPQASEAGTVEPDREWRVSGESSPLNETEGPARACSSAAQRGGGGLASLAPICCPALSSRSARSGRERGAAAAVSNDQNLWMGLGEVT